MNPTLYSILSVAFLIIAVVLILVILVQRGRGGGLIGAFGGPGGSSAFGAKTGDVFTVITVILATLFLVIACLLAFRPALPSTVESIAQPVSQTSPIDSELPDSPKDVPVETEQQEKPTEE